ncbi:MAG: tRNA 4-thiouridine(8) synthase ThiI [Candidatus Omnitrophica bacterium]|nr:tRNA 4-thiouridine(8) synthase ThiI [Candidatus Omnitrophota bacterium]
MIKAISLLSGGLDSILASRLILNQGIKIEAVNFTSVFYSGSEEQACLPAKTAAQAMGISLKIFDISRELFGIIKNPQHGYGRNINPCIDCHAFMFKKAYEYMKEIGAGFLVTGEVLGERPMSQRKDALELIDRHIGLEGFILRPLSAKLLTPTIPEEKRWVDRDKLLDIKGRSRKPQIELAKEFKITDYPTPAGGCLLTDLGFANRLRDLIKYKQDFSVTDVYFLKIGRHFRLTENIKLVVGRNDRENKRLLYLAQPGDICFRPVSTKGPVAVAKGILDSAHISAAASIVARYSDKLQDSRMIEVEYRKLPGSVAATVVTAPAPDLSLEKIRI